MTERGFEREKVIKRESGRRGRERVKERESERERGVRKTEEVRERRG